ncbi:hypothetical protein B0T10DRAFT_585265 [Thelonectria olida]|uniref:Peptidase S8/S53 domain-containing protein n=1 Tax=Thelonectria olida TaxID=1576542 RepID=A0A9P9AJ24_9HYPO|nr:hypothetical protein B0T10DRAFT_585265 [Thelonectria olida]
MNDDAAIRDAIIRAEAMGIIIFTSASNSGVNESRAFPASMDRVLGVYAADGHGNPGEMNPNPLSHRDDISTLGVAIPSPLAEDELLADGTSFSTSIATAITANILSLVEACFGESEEDEALRLRASGSDGMRLLFLKAAVPRVGYDYIYPHRVAKDRSTIDGVRD